MVIGDRGIAKWQDQKMNQLVPQSAFNTAKAINFRNNSLSTNYKSSLIFFSHRKYLVRDMVKSVEITKKHKQRR